MVLATLRQSSFDKSESDTIQWLSEWHTHPYQKTAKKKQIGFKNVKYQSKSQEIIIMGNLNAKVKM